MRRYLKAGPHPMVFSDMQWSLQSVLEYSHPEQVPAPAPTRPPIIHHLHTDCLSTCLNASRQLPDAYGHRAGTHTEGARTCLPRLDARGCLYGCAHTRRATGRA